MASCNRSPTTDARARRSSRIFSTSCSSAVTAPSRSADACLCLLVRHRRSDLSRMVEGSDPRERRLAGVAGRRHGEVRGRGLRGSPQTTGSPLIHPWPRSAPGREPRAPGRVAGCPPELPSRAAIVRAARPRGPGRAGDGGRRRADGVAEGRDPRAPRRGLVVAHVHDAGRPFERLDRRRHSVVEVDEARHVAVGDQPAGARVVGAQPVGCVPRPRAVEQPVAQQHPLRHLPHGALERRDAEHRRPSRLRGFEVERDPLAGRVVAGLVDPRDALGDHPRNLGGAGRVDQVAGALGPERGVGGAAALAQVRQLVQDDIGSRARQRRVQRVAVVGVGHHRLGAQRPHQRAALGPAGHRGHRVPCRPQPGQEAPADHAGPPGHEDMHRSSSQARRATGRPRRSSSS